MEPFIEYDVRVQSGTITLAGSVTLPSVEGAFPGVVFLTGSGIQNRNNELYGFPMFQLLAKELATCGIASLRCDDRGAGGSGGKMEQSTLNDFATDALAALSILKLQPGIDPHRTGLCGHSEGGTVAPLAARHSPDDVAFIILLAGPGAATEENIILQTQRIFESDGMPVTQVRREVELQRKIFDVLRRRGDVQTLLTEFSKKAHADIAEMQPFMQRALSDVDAYARILFTQQMEMMDTPWFRSLLASDPREVLQSVCCPVLACFGSRDLQVSAALNLSAMKRSLSNNPDVSLHEFPNANHLFQPAVTGSPTEYGKLPHSFVDGFVEMISGWIQKR